jgi:hypothetical protein
MNKAIVIILLIGSFAAATQLSFNSGQMDQMMKYRVDMDNHSMAAEELTNILIAFDGMAYKRPGTEFIDDRITDINIPTTITATTDLGLVSAQDAYLVWYDEDIAELEADSSLNDLCSSIAVCIDGSVVATCSPNGLMKFDEDRTVVASFFTPSGSWPSNPYYVQAVRATDDSDYIYACYNGTNPNRGGVFKFDNSTGDEEWVTLGSDLSGTIYIDSQGMAVDSSDNVYFSAIITGTGYGVIILDLDGVQTDTTEYVHNMSTVRDIIVDETLGRIFISGGIKLASPYHQLAAYDLDGTNETTFSIGNVQSHIISCVLTDGTYVYACGTQTASGVGGADATVWKLDTDLTLQASYDTGNWARYMCWDVNDNIIVKQETTPAGGDNYIVLDSDLNHIETIAYTDYGDYGWGEIQWWDKTGPTIRYDIWTFDGGAADGIRLIPFEYDVNDAYVLEFGHRYIGFLRTTE